MIISIIFFTNKNHEYFLDKITLLASSVFDNCSFELIVVLEDSSSALFLENFFETYYKKSNNIRINCVPLNTSAISKIHFGIELSHGTHILPISDDDLLFSDSLQELSMFTCSLNLDYGVMLTYQLRTEFNNIEIWSPVGLDQVSDVKRLEYFFQIPGPNMLFYAIHPKNKILTIFNQVLPKLSKYPFADYIISAEIVKICRYVKFKKVFGIYNYDLWASPLGELRNLKRFYSNYFKCPIYPFLNYFLLAFFILKSYCDLNYKKKLFIKFICLKKSINLVFYQLKLFLAYLSARGKF